MAPKVDQDVAEMRDQIERENEESRARAASGAPPQVEEDPDLELDDQLGLKVAGTE